MSLARRFYKALVDTLYDLNDLQAGASLLQADRAIAKRFGISESAARNWRRGKNARVAPPTADAIIALCQKIAPARVADLEFISRLSRGTQEVKLAAELLVEELTSQVLSYNATWHIYSGPLKMAFDLNSDPSRQMQLMSRASTLTERILEMGIDQANIPCIGELVRYSTHGWYVKGFLKIREASLSSETLGIHDDSIGKIEAALYIGDGCAVPCLFSGNTQKAKVYVNHALEMLQTVSPAEERRAPLEVGDALTMIRAIQVLIACHEGYEGQREQIDFFAQTISHTRAQNEWIEGTRQEALGYIELARRTDFAKAAYHFGQAGIFLDAWLARFGIPFSSTSPKSLSGYALLMTEGPTDNVRSQISESLIRTIDHGAVGHQIRARLCQAIFYDCMGDKAMSNFHRDKTDELVQQYGLSRWYNMLHQLLAPVNLTTGSTKVV